MRNGILLAEDTPANIMQKFRSDNLEDAFLILSQKQGVSEEADTTIGRAAGQKVLEAIEVHNAAEIEANKKNDKEKEASQRTAENEARKDTNAPAVIHKTKLKRNQSFQEQKPDGLIGKLTFTSQIRMKALLMKNILQLIRQPSWVSNPVARLDAMIEDWTVTSWKKTACNLHNGLERFVTVRNHHDGSWRFRTVMKSYKPL